MNSRKTSISHVINDNTVSTVSEHHYQQQQHQSTSGVCSLKNILQPDDGSSSHVQHASSSQHSQPPPPPQQYNLGGAGNSGSGSNNTVGYGGSYPNEQQSRDYYHHRSHQPPHSQSQPSHNQEQNNQSYSRDDEASSILLLLSNQSTQPSGNPNYISPRDPYPPKDNEQQMSDVVEAATSLSNISNPPKSNPQQFNSRPRAKSSSMSIASLIGDESGISESGHSLPNGSSMESSQHKYQPQAYPEDIRNGDINSHHQHNNMVDYNYHRKHMKKLSSGSTPLVVNTNPKIPQKEPRMIQKRTSPQQKRRPSEPSEFTMKPKIHHSHHFSHGPPTTSGGPKLTDLREHLGEERNINRITPIAPMAAQMAPIHQGGMDWDRSQPYHQSRQTHNIPPQTEIRHPPPPISKSGGSPSLHSDSQRLNYMSTNERQIKTSPTGPSVHAPNGYTHGHGVGPVGGMIEVHQDVPPPQPSQPLPQMPPLRGQQSAFSNQFHKKYNDMKHDPKMKRNAPHAYISYMIYTNQMENGKGKDGHLQSQLTQGNMSSRQIIPNGIPNGSPPLNNDHGMVNPPVVSHHQPQINGGNMYSSREQSHPGYPPIQPASTGYIHPSEVNPGAQQRRISTDQPMHINTMSGSRNAPHGYSPTHVNGPSVEDHQPPPPPRHSISSPNLLPIHSSANQHSSQRQILPLLPNSQHPPQRHTLSPTSPSTSRPGSIQTALPPIQSNPSHLQSHHHHHNHPSSSHAHHHHHYPQEHSNHQNHAHHGHSHTQHSHYHQPVSQSSQPPPPAYMTGPPQHSSYGGKSPIPPPIPPQSPPPSLISSRQPNHYHHTSPPVPPPQSGSRLSSSHHHHHHHPPPSEPSSNILNPPLTRLLDSQQPSSGYGSVHPHHLHHSNHPTSGIGPGPVHIAPVPRGAHSGYY